MLGAITFSLVGTIIFALIALGLVWLMAVLGDGQRVRIAGGRTRSEGAGARRPGRSATQRARR